MYLEVVRILCKGSASKGLVQVSESSHGHTPNEADTMEAAQDIPVPVLTAVALVIVTTVVIMLLMKTKPALDPVEFKPFPLIKREEISHDTRRLPSLYRLVQMPSLVYRVGST
ncbi:hypothetical protein THAOC_13154 [Thalassiosira oceanica]|uniref:Uncharacterized protein n=1 Tax=Thalassiosira oceanica TaxID=159749 RepID=K0SY60_THAOC|nr:hypothetical protein THAOC_13154 [Thalassiosira oceanica]|eukprot:EJK65951.1 hypothetical protein THAOC_13154 [Thalassiosira oceanica]